MVCSTCIRAKQSLSVLRLINYSVIILDYVSLLQIEEEKILRFGKIEKLHFCTGKNISLSCIARPKLPTFSLLLAGQDIISVESTKQIVLRVNRSTPTA